MKCHLSDLRCNQRNPFLTDCCEMTFYYSHINNNWNATMPYLQLSSVCLRSYHVKWGFTGHFSFYNVSCCSFRSLELYPFWQVVMSKIFFQRRNLSASSRLNTICQLPLTENRMCTVVAPSERNKDRNKCYSSTRSIEFSVKILCFQRSKYEDEADDAHFWWWLCQCNIMIIR